MFEEDKVLRMAGGPGRRFSAENKDFVKPLKAGKSAEAALYEQCYATRPASNIPTGDNSKDTLVDPLSALKALRPFLPTYRQTTESELFIENVLAGYSRPGVLDLKLGKPSHDSARSGPLPRESVGNLLGLCVHGVVADGLVLLNRVNGYQGKFKPIDHFHATFEKFLQKVAASSKIEDRRALLVRMNDLIKVIASLPGFTFYSCSLLFVFEQDAECQAKNLPNFYLIDFERCCYLEMPISSVSPSVPNAEKTEAESKVDEHLLRSLRYAKSCLRQNWFPSDNVVHVYLVRHGERHDYTDFDWAPQSPHPHDAPLSAAGERQAQDLVDRLRHLKNTRIAVAPMQRAILSAEPVAATLGVKLSVEPGFCEFLCKKTRSRVPSLFSRDLSISPWVDDDYNPAWKDISLETWPDVFTRTAHAAERLVQQARESGGGNVIIVSHRSTLQTVFRHLLPDYTGNDKLEYGAIAMLCEDEPGQFEVASFNELSYLRDQIASPSSNPFRHIEGYYEDLKWDNYKSTATMWEDNSSSSSDV